MCPARLCPKTIPGLPVRAYLSLPLGHFLNPPLISITVSKIYVHLFSWIMDTSSKYCRHGTVPCDGAPLMVGVR